MASLVTEAAAAVGLSPITLIAVAVAAALVLAQLLQTLFDPERARIAAMMARLPGPPTLPLIGNAHQARASRDLFGPRRAHRHTDGARPALGVRSWAFATTSSGWPCSARGSLPTRTCSGPCRPARLRTWTHFSGLT
jgi:hypothetical protein